MIDFKKAADVAKIARDAGRQGLMDAMDARRRDSPYEGTEAWLKIAIAQALLRETRMARRPIRVFDELDANQITNITDIRVGRGKKQRRPVDISLLHPLMDEDGKPDWWDLAALGLIEVKKDYSKVGGDAEWLGKVKNRANFKQSLAWVMVTVLVNGKTEDDVRENERGVWDVVQKHGFDRLSDCAPQEPPWRPDWHSNGQPDPVEDRWFDLVCYGKEI